MILSIFFTFFLLFSTSSSEIVFDYCVGDPTLPSGPAGYSCKNPAKVTVGDFVHSGLDVVGNTNNTFKLAVNPAFSYQFPGLNGMGISMLRYDLGVGGAVPLHTHRVSELLLLMEGKVISGFIDDNSKAYYTTLNKGDIMVYPPSLVHFQVNVGSTPAYGFVSFNGQNPGVQIFDNALFMGDLPSELIEKITLLDYEQVKKLKKVLGGSN